MDLDGRDSERQDEVRVKEPTPSNFYCKIPPFPVEVVWVGPRRSTKPYKRRGLRHRRGNQSVNGNQSGWRKLNCKLKLGGIQVPD